MAEAKLVVEHREQLWRLLIEAAQFEHMIMCQYLYACFSLKTGPDEGLTAEQADAVARWRETVAGIAIEEMLHLALIMNVMTAIRARPPLSRPRATLVKVAGLRWQSRRTSRPAKPRPGSMSTGWREAIRHGRTTAQLPGLPFNADGGYLTTQEERGGRAQ